MQNLRKFKSYIFSFAIFSWINSTKLETLVYTEGAPEPQGTCPQETIPTTVLVPFWIVTSGPPESP